MNLGHIRGVRQPRRWDVTSNEIAGLRLAQYPQLEMDTMLNWKLVDALFHLAPFYADLLARLWIAVVVNHDRFSHSSTYPPTCILLSNRSFPLMCEAPTSTLRQNAVFPRNVDQGMPSKSCPAQDAKLMPLSLNRNHPGPKESRFTRKGSYLPPMLSDNSQGTDLVY